MEVKETPRVEKRRQWLCTCCTAVTCLPSCTLLGSMSFEPGTPTCLPSHTPCQIPSRQSLGFGEAPRGLNHQCSNQSLRARTPVRHPNHKSLPGHDSSDHLLCTRLCQPGLESPSPSMRSSVMARAGHAESSVAKACSVAKVRRQPGASTRQKTVAAAMVAASQEYCSKKDLSHPGD